MYTISDIKTILPHREPFLMIDVVIEMEPGLHAVAKKCVSGNESYFLGHFPNNPVMPGVLIVEALAQTGAFAILSLPENKGKTAYFGGIKNVKFKKMVKPGDVLILKTNIIKNKGSLGIGHGVAYVDNSVVAEGDLTFFIK